jgi:hypothetical protein
MSSTTEQTEEKDLRNVPCRKGTHPKAEPRSPESLLRIRLERPIIAMPSLEYLKLDLESGKGLFSGVSSGNLRPESHGELHAFRSSDRPTERMDEHFADMSPSR